MNLDDFRADLEAEVKNALTFGDVKTTAFAEKITQLMQEAEYLNGDFQESFFTGIHPKRRSNLRVDGWLQDETDNSIVLFIVHYTDTGENMNKTLAERNFKMLAAFVDAVLTTNLEIEESTSTAELAEILKTDSDEKIKFILLTNAQRSLTVKEIKNVFVRDKEIDCQLWDIERIFAVYNSMQVREPIKINFDEYGYGLPCLKATNAGEECESFLCVIPGKVLADIYDKYGSRILEGNVRSFLSTKRAVNKNIRKTILNNPEMFFAFNNGIAATAKQLEIKNCGGLFITSATDFQIINGGQTTALLLNARLKDKVSLEKIFVQMKLTRIGEMATDEQDKLIGEISRSSNSQNKVSEADFFSTHPFHVEMEKISRRILAEPVGGVQYQTKWFYERARGQYVQEQIKMTAAQKRNFQRINPKSQVMSKTDFAKYRMSWQECPEIVSKGAQANFMKFAEEISTVWEKNPAQFNEHYFRETAALAIMFHAVEKIVSAQDWYKISKSYRANIVTYSLAIFHHTLKTKYPNDELDLLAVWRAQKMPDAFIEIFTNITFAVNNFITGERPITNVTQWCKRTDCWSGMKSSLTVDLPEDFSRFLANKISLKTEKKSAIEIQQTSFELDAQKKVLSFSGETWKKIFQDAITRKLLTADENSALKTAMKIPSKIPQPFQCEKLLRLLERLEENGLTYESDGINE